MRHERPLFPRIDPRHWLAKGLVFAGLGGGASSGRYADASGYGNNGTLTGFAGAGDTPLDKWQYIPQLGRWGLGFDGSNDYVSLPEIPIQPPITIAAWVTPSAINRYALIATTGNLAANVYGAGLQLRSTGAVGLEYGNGQPQLSENRRLLYSGNNVMSAGKPAHVAGVIRSLGNDMLLYVNGVAVSGSYSGTYVGNIIYDGTIRRIGYGDFEYVLGSIGDVVIANRALSPPEIAALADPSNVMLSGLILPPRRRLIVVGAGGAAPSVKPWLYLRRNRLIGVGQ